MPDDAVEVGQRRPGVPILGGDSVVMQVARQRPRRKHPDKRLGEMAKHAALCQLQ
jgi:hypothetical protein